MGALIIRAVLAGLFVAVSLAAVASDQGVPKFEDYPPDAIEGLTSPAAPNLDSPDLYRYRTRIREAASQPANFAGHYGLAIWGCDTGCVTGAIVDHLTGASALLPFSICCSAKLGTPDFDPVVFRPLSRLIVFSGKIDEEGEDAAHFYLFNGSGFTHIRSVPYEGTQATPSSAPQPAGPTPASVSAPPLQPPAPAPAPRGDCETISDDRARLACFDGRTAAVSEAAKDAETHKAFTTADLDTMHETYGKNQARFSRDYVGHTFADTMIVSSVKEEIFERGEYTITFDGGVYCRVKDNKTIDYITNLDKGDHVSVKGTINDQAFGDLILDDCSIIK